MEANPEVNAARDPIISIIIPLFNKQDSIFDTINSIKSQSYSNYEVIIVDDGSTDDSYINAQKAIVGDSRFILFSKNNGGVCSARNFGINKASSAYLAFLDADDLWDAQYLQEQVKMIEDFPQCYMWGINYAETENGEIIRIVPTGLTPGYRGIVDNYFTIKGRISDLFCSSSVVIRKESFDKVGLFDERIKYSEDLDMWFRIIARFPVAFYDRYLVSYVFDASDRAMKRDIKLRYFLPFFVDKYSSFKDSAVFYSWINRWSAQNIAKYYFGTDKEGYSDAKEAKCKLDYSVIPDKYKIYFKLPYLIGKISFKLVRWRNKKKNS